jgi:hypothetical protein
MKFLSIFLFAVFVSSTQAATEVQAPFGFAWNQTQSDLRRKGFEMACSTLNNVPVESCKVSTSPRKFSKADFFQLLFVPGEGLQKVMMFGKDITGDPYGSTGKEQYRALKASLTKKYGAPKLYEWSATELYKESDEFYECLAYQSCGSQSAYWVEGVIGTIVLEINGASRGKGYLNLNYESARWSDLLDKMKSEMSAGDDDSL